MKLETINFTVPQQAIAFLAAVGACLVLLIIFYMFITKRLCFSKKSSTDRRSQQLDILCKDDINNQQLEDKKRKKQNELDGEPGKKCEKTKEKAIKDVKNQSVDYILN